MKQVLSFLTVLSCILSIIGSLSIIITYLLYSKLRKPARKLLVYLSFADLCTSIVYMISELGCKNCEYPCNNFVRELLALLGIFFPVASFLWTSCIASYILGATFRIKWVEDNVTQSKKGSTNKSNLFMVFHIICWGIPSITVGLLIILNETLPKKDSIPFGTNTTGGWCWVENTGWQIIGGKGIEILSYIYMIVIYLLTYWKLKKDVKQNIYYIEKSSKLASDNNIYNSNNNSNNNNSSNSVNNWIKRPTDTTSKIVTTSTSPDIKVAKEAKALQRLLLIPLVFVLVRLPGTLHMILDKYYENDNNWLTILQSFTDPLQGCVNGILFVLLVSAVRNEIRKSCNKCCKTNNYYQNLYYDTTTTTNIDTKNTNNTPNIHNTNHFRYNKRTGNIETTNQLSSKIDDGTTNGSSNFSLT